MNRSLEQAWQQINQDLDEVLDLDALARQAWLDRLQARDPQRAERVRPYMLDLAKLESDNFLGDPEATQIRLQALRASEEE